LDGTGERQILLFFADGENEPAGLRLVLQPFYPREARDWLTAVSTDLLTGTHAYLLPCDAVYQEYQDREKGCAPDGHNLFTAIKEMAGDEWRSFPSLWGPVPTPRLYEPPAPGEASRMVERRFEPFFKKITGREVLR